jgi:hypothetical protein
MTIRRDQLPADIEYRVGTDEEAERADYTVCALAGEQPPRPGYELEPCSVCGAMITFRLRNVPKRPPRICPPCGIGIFNRH